MYTLLMTKSTTENTLKKMTACVCYYVLCNVGRSSVRGRVHPRGGEGAAVSQVHRETGRNGEGREGTAHALSPYEGQDSPPPFCPHTDCGRFHRRLSFSAAGFEANNKQVRGMLI